MGSIMSRNCPTSAYIYRSTTPCEPAPASAPDPENWLALRIQPMSGIAGTYTVMMLQYPDCTNFEGRKVLVYPGAAKLDAKVPRDPHFADDGSGPIARFPPDDEGWRNALMFAEMLANLGAP